MAKLAKAPVVETPVVKSTNGIAKLVAQYNSLKDLNGTEARKIRKQIRAMGKSIRDIAEKPEPKAAVKKAPVKQASVKGPSVKAKIVDEEDTDNEA